MSLTANPGSRVFLQDFLQTRARKGEEEKIGSTESEGKEGQHQKDCTCGHRKEKNCWPSLSTDTPSWGSPCSSAPGEKKGTNSEGPNPVQA